MLVASLREVIQKQAQEIEQLKDKLRVASLAPPPPPPAATAPDQTEAIKELEFQLDNMKGAFEVAEQKRKEVEQEHEDLLVLLDELNDKRSRDKQRMKEANLEVSEDEAEEEEEEE